MLDMKRIHSLSLYYMENYAPINSVDVDILLDNICRKLYDGRVSEDNKIHLREYYERLADLQAIRGRKEDFE